MHNVLIYDMAFVLKERPGKRDGETLYIHYIIHIYMQRQQFLQAHIQSHQQSVESYFHAIKHQPAFASIRMLCSAFSYFAAANLLPFVFILFVEMKACCRLVQLLVSPVMAVTKMWIYWPGRAGSRWHQYIKHSYELKKKRDRKREKKKNIANSIRMWWRRLK